EVGDTVDIENRVRAFMNDPSFKLPADILRREGKGAGEPVSRIGIVLGADVRAQRVRDGKADLAALDGAGDAVIRGRGDGDVGRAGRKAEADPPHGGSAPECDDAVAKRDGHVESSS